MSAQRERAPPRVRQLLPHRRLYEKLAYLSMKSRLARVQGDEKRGELIFVWNASLNEGELQRTLEVLADGVEQRRQTGALVKLLVCKQSVDLMLHSSEESLGIEYHVEHLVVRPVLQLANLLFSDVVGSRRVPFRSDRGSQGALALAPRSASAAH